MSAATVKVTTRVPRRDFIRVGHSRIQGTGVFAKRKIPRGSRIIEYVGAHVPLRALVALQADGPSAMVYAFRLDETTVIDGARGGNDSRFINHSCEPNCEAYRFDGHMYIYAMRDIPRGEELTFDYRLGAPAGPGARKRALSDHACHCGSATCRGTMVAQHARRST